MDDSKALARRSACGRSGVWVTCWLWVGLLLLCAVSHRALLSCIRFVVACSVLSVCFCLRWLGDLSRSNDVLRRIVKRVVVWLGSKTKEHR